MPSSRAILSDITENGLNPAVAHTRCSHDGRLYAVVSVVPSKEQKDDINNADVTLTSLEKDNVDQDDIVPVVSQADTRAQEDKVIVSEVHKKNTKQSAVKRPA